MIDLKLPEPPLKECVRCFRRDGNLIGKLIHWPNADAKSDVRIYGTTIEPFSMWTYTCRYCRGVETKRRRRLQEKTYKEASSDYEN